MRGHGLEVQTQGILDAIQTILADNETLFCGDRTWINLGQHGLETQTQDIRYPKTSWQSEIPKGPFLLSPKKEFKDGSYTLQEGFKAVNA